MARQETVTVTYSTRLCDGLRESDSSGRVYDDHRGMDEPYRIKVVKETATKVVDGRGVNWQESGTAREDVIDLTLEQAADLAKAIVSDLTYAAIVAEHRVLVPPPKED